MSKQMIVCASPHTHKYYFEPKFSDIPQAIQEELTEAVANIGEKVNAVIAIGFYEDGDIYIEQTQEDDVFVDEIGAELEIKRFQKEKKELLKALKLWYMLYRTQQGKYVKALLMCQNKGLGKAQIYAYMQEHYGEEAKEFVEKMLEEN